MKLLYASQGRSVHNELFLQAFRDRGWPHVYVEVPTAPTASQPGADGEIVVPCRAPRGQTAESAQEWLTDVSSRLRSILDRIRPNVVLAGPIPSVAASFALAGTRNLVALSWGSDMLVEAESADWIRTLTIDTLRCSAAAVGDCRAVRQKILEFAPNLTGRCLTIPWGIEPGRFAPGPAGTIIRRRLDWDPNVVLISTRRFEPGYALDVLLDAFGQVLAVIPDVRLILCGDGSLRDQIDGKIGRLELGEFIHLPGTVSRQDLADFFHAADLYVSSALSDGTSVSLLEAMASGLPAVVTAGMGNVDWIRDGENGWLAPPGDAAGLAKSLLAAIARRADWERIGRENRDIVSARADWRLNRERLYSLLETVGSSS